MIDVIHQNIKQFGEEEIKLPIWQSTTYQKDKSFQNVVKLYYDLDHPDKHHIIFEPEAYVEDMVSNTDYLLLEPPRAMSSYNYTTLTNIFYLIGIDLKKEMKEADKLSDAFKNAIQKSKMPVDVLHHDEKIAIAFQELLSNILFSFYRCRLEDKKLYLSLDTQFLHVNESEPYGIEKFAKEYGGKNIFTLGYIKDGQKHLLCKDQNYVDYLHLLQQSRGDDTKLKAVGVCDFCQQTKKLIDRFGAGNYPLKQLKNFTSTMPSLLYNNHKNSLEKNIRCCTDCFETIFQADYRLNEFHIGQLREIKIKSSNKTSKKTSKSRENSYEVYAFIDVPFRQEIAFEDIKLMMKTLFGDRNALDAIKDTAKDFHGFEEEWRVILNIFIVFRGSKKEKNETVLNVRNINSHLFKKYHTIFEFINDLNEELTYRTWKGNFADIFSTISKADKRVTFSTFEAFFNEKSFNTNLLIKEYLKYVQKKFTFSKEAKKDQPYKNHYEHLLLDITNILIIDTLRQKEESLEFDAERLIETKTDKEGKVTYTKRSAKEIAEALYFEWSTLETALFDLGMILQESISEIERSKKTDIEKAFMRKMDFTGMHIDDVMGYIGYLESKFQVYDKFIYRLDDKRERLAALGMALNQKDAKISAEKAAYLIAFGYELSTTLSNKIGAKVNQNKKKEQQS